MTLTASSVLPLGTQAPSFRLVDIVSGLPVEVPNTEGFQATVIMFICNHCPYVKHIQRGLVDLCERFKGASVNFIAINSNDVTRYPEDHPEAMKTVAMDHRYPFSYVFDESQDVARSYMAACTPEFFVFDAGFGCVYRGQFDGSRPGNGIPVTGGDLYDAITRVLQGEKPATDQFPSIGCNIKWKR